MTRKTWLKSLLTPLLPLALLGAKKPDIWSTPHGQYVLALRDEVRKMGYWDDLREDWQDVERALLEGHKVFKLHPSRLKENGLNSFVQTYSVRPVYLYEVGAFDSKYYVKYLEMPFSKRS